MKNPEITIETTPGTADFDAIPRGLQDFLVRPILKAVEAYFKQPGVKERFEEWKIEQSKEGGLLDDKE